MRRSFLLYIVTIALSAAIAGKAMAADYPNALPAPKAPVAPTIQAPSAPQAPQVPQIPQAPSLRSQAKPPAGNLPFVNGGVENPANAAAQAPAPVLELLKQLVLVPGKEPPKPLPPKPEYVRNLFTRAVLEDGRTVEIVTDHSMVTTARIIQSGQRPELLPNGHYELYKNHLKRLPQNEYGLTDDSSMLLSIYKGQVINYVPRWAVNAGEFVKFELQPQ